MKRILIIGCSGAGKTTLALALGRRLHLPVHHLDQLWWQPGWVQDTRDNFDRKLAELLRSDCWVIDGDYSRTVRERLHYADTVIWLDYQRLRCVGRVLRRTISLYGRSRPDMPDGCPERFDWTFLRYVWNYNRDARPKLAAAVADFTGKTLVMRTPSQTAAWLRDLAPASE